MSVERKQHILRAVSFSYHHRGEVPIGQMVIHVNLNLFHDYFDSLKMLAVSG